MLKIQQLKRLHLGPITEQVASGECVVIQGGSGAGKSVLLRAIADLDPHEGNLWLDDQPAAAMTGPQWRSQVTYVAANSGWWSARVADHVRPEVDGAAFEALGIAAEVRDWPVSRLSTGERQRLALLRAFGPSLRVLLLDEPTSGLDPVNVDRVETMLKARLAEGLAILLVTHDAAQAERLGTRRLRLEDGQLRPEPA